MSPLQRKAAEYAETLARCREFGSLLWLAGYDLDTVRSGAAKNKPDVAAATLDGWHRSNLAERLRVVDNTWRPKQ